MFYSHVVKKPVLLLLFLFVSFPQRLKGMFSVICLRNFLHVFTVFLLFFSQAQYVQASGGSVSFVGNDVIDYLGYCEWGTGYINATAVIKRDGVQVAQTSEKSKPNRVELYYRDSPVSKGSSHEYLTCCIFEKESGGTYESCPATGSTATAGEVGGTLGMDLEMSGSPVVMDTIRVKDGVTLSISDTTIERAADSNSGWIRAENDPALPGTGGTIRIVNSTLSSDITVLFSSAGNNLFSGNTINGTRLSIDEETSIQVTGNTFTNMRLEIADDTTSHILRNTFQNSKINISDYQGEPTVVIDGNDISAEISSIISARGGNITIQGNTLSGQYSEQYENNVADGITIYRGNSASKVTVTISDNIISGFRDALELGAGADVTISGNVIKDNDNGLTMTAGSTAVVNGNTFAENKRGLKFYSGNLALTNNCISTNSITGLLYSNDDTALNAVSNWWGQVSGPYHYKLNPDGTGDKIFDSNELVIFSPWLTEPNCIDVPDLPEPEPASLNVTASPETLPADGQSQSILTIILTDDNDQPLANAQVTLDTPDFGAVSQSSGSTDAQGKLEITYTAPEATQLQGEDYVDLTVRYPDTAVTQSSRIHFSFASIDVWAEPHIAPYASDVAIIPGDERFPGRYQFTLRDFNGQPSAGKLLKVSIPDSTIARLESNGQSGRLIEVTTDAQGKASIDYVYLGRKNSLSGPFEDTITIAQANLSMPVEAKVSVGLDIDISDINTPQQDTGVFPKTLGMRLRLKDFFRPNLDLRAYLSALEKLSGKTIAMDITMNWLNRPTPEFMDSYRTFFPNWGNDDPPELYAGTGIINYGDAGLTQVIVEALDSPQVSFGANTLPAILFEDPGNYWFSVQLQPVILPDGANSSTDYVRGVTTAGFGRMFGANVLEGAESVFQSVVCSVKPTNRAQFTAMTLLIDNPYFNLIPPSAAIKMMVKASGIICDYMQGNYATAAINMVSLSADGLENAYTNGLLDISLEQYLKLGKIVRLNQAYSRFDNIKGAKEMFSSTSHSRAVRTLPFADAWPEDLSQSEYEEIVNKTAAGEMAAYDELMGWQLFAILNEGAVRLSRPPDDTEYFSYNGVHVFLLSDQDNVFNIKTGSDTDIYRYSRSSRNEVNSARYAYTGNSEVALLSLSLAEQALQVDIGADGRVDEFVSPVTRQFLTSLAAFDISLNQEIYQSGDKFLLSVSVDNPGDPLPVDIYLVLVAPDGSIFSFMALKPGISPLLANFTLPADFTLPETPILSFKVPQGVSDVGSFQIISAMAYAGTIELVAGKFSVLEFSFR